MIKEIKFNSSTRKHDIWMFNNSLLHDYIYGKKRKINYTTGKDWLRLTQSFQKVSFSHGYRRQQID